MAKSSLGNTPDSKDKTAWKHAYQKAREKRQSPKNDDKMTNTQVIRLHKFARSKIEAIGDFATGLAHEINQPLTVINSVLGYLTDRVEKEELEAEKAIDLLGKASGEVKRISHLLDRLYEFGGGNIGPLERISLKEMLEELLEIMGRRLLSFSVELSLTIPDKLPPLRGNKSQLKQGLLYLFDNAVESLEKSISNEKHISLEAVLDDAGQNLIIYFSDNGQGVDDALLDKIFEPFFTTKTEGLTPGLGLSILFSIIKKHNGRIRCLANPEEGAVFEIVLPIYAQ